MNILIVEDEKKTADFLQELIETNNDCIVVNKCESVGDTVDYLKRNQLKIDLIFMDVQLGDGESFEIFNQIEVIKPVVFCTAYSHYLLTSFQNNGVAYILKPFQQKDIDGALQKIKLLSQSLTGNKVKSLGLQHRKEYQNTFISRYREKMIPVSVEEIACIKLEDSLVCLYRFKGDKFPLFESLDDIEAVMDPRQFFRINRQTIVNRKAVKEIEPYFNRKIVLTLSCFAEKIQVSRLKVTPFMEWLKGEV